MVKGVNKKIIEINNPESIYFERAVFYLKPNVVTLPEAVSRSEINRFICNLEREYQKPKYKINIGRLIVPLIASMALLASLIVILR